jgi:Mg-chelatase subunit ChlD
MEYLKIVTPVYLLFGIILVLVLWIYDRKSGLPLRSGIIRFIIIGLLLTGLSEPQVLMMTANRCVLFVVDVSKSLSEKEINGVKEYILSKAEEKKQDDRVGVLIFAEDTGLVIPPSDLNERNYLTEGFNLDEYAGVDPGFTDIEGAVLLASRLFPEGFRKKIVLVTDGNENTGKVANLYDELNSGRITLDVLPAGGVKHKEVFVESLRAPSRVRAGTPFMLEAVISSNTKTDGEISIYTERQRDVVIKETLKIVPGVGQIHRFPLTVEEGGYHTISVNLDAAHDRLSMNNSTVTSLYAEGRPKVLMITDMSAENSGLSKRYLEQILIKNNINTEFLSHEQLPTRTLAYAPYDAVILNDISSGPLMHEQMQALSSAVHDLGVGLIMVSGMHSIGSQGFAGTPVEYALPVRIGPSSGKRPSSIDLVLVMDKSGSMSEGDGESKIELAIESTQSIMEVFGENDQAGIIAFDSKPHLIVVPGSIENREEIIRKIQRIKPRGSTDFYPALLQAYDWLKKSDAVYKHIILLSDGKTREKNFNEIIRNIQGGNITVSVIGIGRDSNITLMKDIAMKGKGRFFQVEDDLHELSKIFRIDTMMAARTSYVEETFSPRLNDPDPIINGIPIIMPEMHGYMVTSPRQTASVPVVSHKGDPIVGYWRYGLGRASIFTGDDGSQWSRDWISWDKFGRLWVQLVKRTMRTGSNEGKPPSFLVRGNRVEIKHEVSEEAAIMPVTVAVKILYPEGTASDLRLFRSSASVYSGVVDNLAPGRYVVTAAIESHDGNAKISRGEFRVNGYQEFLTLNRNDTLLAEIALNAGGRVLKGEDPLFENDGEGVYRYVSAWPFLFMMAAVFFLSEIATNRGINPFLTK